MRSRRQAGILAAPALAFLLAVAQTPTLPPQAGEGWLRVNTPHFILFGNVDAPKLVEVARGVERFREALQTATVGLARTSPLPTYFFVFRDRASFAPYVLGSDGAPKNLGGYFVGADDRNFVAMEASERHESYRVVFHEYVHFVVDNNIPGAPAWLNEGLAEFYSTLSVAQGSPEARLGEAIPAHLAALKGREWMSLDRLFGVDAASPEYNEAERQGLFYAQSWLLVHWLIVDDPARRDRFNRFVNQLRRGVPAREAFALAWPGDSKSLEEALAAYARNEALAYFTFEYEDGPAGAELRTVPVTRAEALARLGELLLAGDPAGIPAAERHLERALALDKENVTARMAYGRLERRRERYDAAAGYFEAAMAMGGAAARTQSGWTLIDRSIAAHPDGIVVAGGSLPDAVVRARELFRQALAIAPDDPLALHGLGRTYRFGSEDPSAGIAALARARELLPTRDSIVADWIALTAAAGRIDAARAALENDLRRRAAPEELLRDAESGIAAAEVNRAAEAAADGRIEEGRAMLQSALDRTRDTQVRALLAENLAQFHDFVAKQAAVSTFNEAAAAARRGEFDRATRLYEQVAATTGDPDMKKAAAEMARTARQEAVGNRVAARVAKAVTRANQGEAAAAVADLEALLRDEPGMSDRLRAEVRQLRDRLQATLRQR